MRTKKTIVIKFGGHAMDIANARDLFLKQLLQVANEGVKIVLVHGGGPAINELLKMLDIQSEFVNGLRVTDDKVLEVVEMALCARVNKALVRDCSRIGLDAVGISGEDGHLLLAEKFDARLGNVGKIARVRPELLECLLERSFLPVVSPVALDEKGDLLNVNADTAAGAIAGALNADLFIFISDVPGVLDKDGKLFAYLSSKAIDSLESEGVISGGMIPKVEACLNARRAGAAQAVILDASKQDSLERLVLAGEIAGTEVDWQA